MLFKSGEDPCFLLVRSGDFVAISSSEGDLAGWWIGRVISRVGSSRDPFANTLFQVFDMDTGIVKIVNADRVKGII